MDWMIDNTSCSAFNKQKPNEKNSDFNFSY